MSLTIVVPAVLLAIVLLVIIVFSVRRRHLSRVIGAFDCSVFVGGPVYPARRPHWRLGVSVYGKDRVDWYPVFALAGRPHLSWLRGDVEIVTREVPSDGEQFAVLPGALLVTCRSKKSGDFRIAVSPEAYAGLASWLEAAPPGQVGWMGRFT
ncbi:DUF2550 domain-containing protein [Spelaeicoccus albus]|uniref:DUF2550 family protein n=1 Tax=Spelaeicoccus albus TaxID=1280376 RepID=A0A7Z0D4Y4_9MICO|nr:DUF2550 domain-containing protein [Spelaeicoccus albus]NYI68966.1 hypothetical protein [Spelaeicoccus albus]